MIDPHNPNSLSQLKIDKWVKSGYVEQWHRRDDINYLPKATVVCLPSYSEVTQNVTRSRKLF